LAAPERVAIAAGHANLHRELVTGKIQNRMPRPIELEDHARCSSEKVDRASGRVSQHLNPDAAHHIQRAFRIPYHGVRQVMTLRIVCRKVADRHALIRVFWQLSDHVIGHWTKIIDSHELRKNLFSLHGYSPET